jgi:hypothetical protein
MSLSNPQDVLGCYRRVTLRLAAASVIIGTLLLLSIEPSTSNPIFNEYHALLPSILGLYNASSMRQYASSSLSSFIKNAQYNGICTPDYLFLVLDGHLPMVVDQNGELVWLESHSVVTRNFRVQPYHGQDYLTYWSQEPMAHGSYYMVSIELHIAS